jgi:thiol-disulfide isomerase/thioredoxin
MQQFKILAFSALLALLAFLACNNLGGGYGLTGTIEGASYLQATLEQAHLDRTSTAIGKVSCDGAGSFSIEKKEAWEEGLYKLTIGAKTMFFVLNGKENVVGITGKLDDLQRLDVKVTGSPTLECYAQAIQGATKTPGQPVTPEVAKNIVAACCTPFMKAFMTLQLFGNNPAANMDLLKQANADLTAAMPGSKYATDFNSLISQVENQMSQQMAAEKIKVGELAPDISLPGPDGKSRALSSLKGKVVLLDFWASWCGPCRKANPHVVETYKKYKGQGFDVFSVSLDGVDPRMSARMPAEELERRKNDGKTKWQNAIEQDNLMWDNHVSDLQHWGSAPAATYGVTSIPKTFLIGRDGKIVAINPRDNLEAEVKKAL